MVTWIPPLEHARRDAIRQGCVKRGWYFLEEQDLPLPADRTVIGLAMWSDYDINFVDALGQSPRAKHVTIAIFDMEDVRTQADLERFIPGGHLPLRTPVVALIRDGRLTQQTEGDAVLAMSVDELISTIERG